MQLNTQNLSVTYGIPFFLQLLPFKGKEFKSGADITLEERSSDGLWHGIADCHTSRSLRHYSCVKVTLRVRGDKGKLRFSKISHDLSSLDIMVWCLSVYASCCG